MNFDFLKAQPATTPIADKETVDRSYRHWRIRTMYAMFIGYAIFYFCRKNLSASTPALIADLHLTKTQIGTIWSALYLSYGISKFVNGAIGDRANARYFMAIGLLLSALMNVAFGMSSSLLTLGIFWTLNGWVQGMGWPPCARLLTHWYSSNERGTKWAIWNTAHQVGGGLILVLGGFLTQYYGWRSSFYVPAAIAVVCSIFLINRLRDTPESLGLPSIEDYRNDHPIGEAITKDSDESPLRQVIRNKDIWFLSIANFFVYLVRYGAMDWAPTFLVEVKGSAIGAASTKTMLFEFLGIGGAVLAGKLSDTIGKQYRWAVNFLYMVVLAFAVAGFWLIPPGYAIVDALTLGAVGFLVYGPQMLVGVEAADVSGKHAAATATGFTGLWGYLGSIVSGVGTGYIVDNYGWNGGFIFFIASALLGAACFFATYHKQKRETPVVRNPAPVAASS